MTKKRAIPRRPARLSARRQPSPNAHLPHPSSKSAKTSAERQSSRNERPRRIVCQVIDGPEATRFFDFFSSAVLPGRIHTFNYVFTTSYLGQTGRYCACVRIIKHRGDGFSFNIGGYIYISLPGESKLQVRRFTGQYSIKSHAGHLYVYLGPCKISTVGLYP